MALPDVVPYSATVVPYCTSAFLCETCRWNGPADPLIWCCPRCAGPLDFAGSAKDLSLDARDLVGSGVARYARWLRLASPVTLGEPLVPLLDLATPDGHVQLRHEGLMPSGSFKDRGASTLMSWLGASGVGRVVVDSSGNGGAALAAYGAKRKIGCEVFVPAAASATKVAQVRSCGAFVVRVDGDRSATRAAAVAAVRQGHGIYASPLWSPAFLLGTQTLAYELWEQCGTVPDAIVLPVGSGSLLLGLARGWTALQAQGMVDRVPRLIAIQEAGCAPLAADFGDELTERPRQPLAEGIQVEDPPRRRQIGSALRHSGGIALAVLQEEIRAAAALLAATGVSVEPTAAAALAGWRRARRADLLGNDERVVVVLTGSGLKTVGIAEQQTGW